MKRLTQNGQGKVLGVCKDPVMVFHAANLLFRSYYEVQRA